MTQNTQLTTLSNKLAAQFDLGSGEGLLDTLKRTAFREPGSYFQRYAAIPDDIAVAAADEVWESVNLVNLRENIAPTLGRATLVLRKDSQHHMSRVLLRKI